MDCILAVTYFHSVKISNKDAKDMCIVIDRRCCINFFHKKKFIFLPTDRKKSHKVTGNDNIFC